MVFTILFLYTQSLSFSLYKVCTYIIYVRIGCSSYFYVVGLFRDVLDKWNIVLMVKKPLSNLQLSLRV